MAFVRRNVLILVGTVIVAAVLLIRLGESLANSLGPAIWWVFAFGLVLVVAGAYMEYQRSTDAKKNTESGQPKI
jgi:hypothetical protein